jgi:hypothetical protein
MDNANFIDCDRFLNGIRKVNSCLPRSKRINYFCSVKEWNKAVKQGKVTSMKDSIQRMKQRFYEHDLEARQMKNIVDMIIKKKSVLIKVIYDCKCRFNSLLDFIEPFNL